MINFEAAANFLSQFGDFAENELVYIIHKIENFDLKAETNYLKAAVQVSRVSYLLSGVMGAFCIDPDGNECLRHFIPEKRFFTDPDGFSQGQCCVYTFRALTPCQVLSMTVTDALALMHEIPALEKLYHFIREQSLRDMLRSHEFVRSGTPGDQYRRMLITQPELIRRVPLKYIADYLGITPQSLSRIRHLKR